MSRLYHRVMAEGCKPFQLDALVPASYIRQERGDELAAVPTAEYAYAADDLADIPVITLDEAAEYVAGLTVGDAGKLKDHPALESFFGAIRPPFDRCFLEFPLRFWTGSTGIGAGWLAEVEEAGEADTSSASWLAEARWFLFLSLIVERWKKGQIFGPCITHVIPLNAHGEPCHPEGQGAGFSDKRPPTHVTAADQGRGWLLARDRSLPRLPGDLRPVPAQLQERGHPGRGSARPTVEEARAQAGPSADSVLRP